MLHPEQAQQLETWLKELETAEEDIGYPIVEQIEELGSDAMPRLVEALQDAKTTKRVHSYVVDALTGIGDARAIAPLFALLGSDDDNLSYLVLLVLESLGGPEEARLLAALQDDNPHMRAGAAALLGRLQMQDAVGTLQGMAAEPEEKVRGAVVEALGRLGYAHSLPTILSAATDESRHVRTATMMVLMEFGGAEAITTLLASLRDKEQVIRFLASNSLLATGDKSAQEGLLVALHDADEGVRGAAMYALRRCGDERAVPPLLRILKEDDRMRWNAAQTLGEVGGPDVIPALQSIQLLATTPNLDLTVRVAIARIQKRHGLA